MWREELLSFERSKRGRSLQLSPCKNKMEEVCLADEADEVTRPTLLWEESRCKGG